MEGDFVSLAHFLRSGNANKEHEDASELRLSASNSKGHADGVSLTTPDTGSTGRPGGHRAHERLVRY